MTAWTVPNISSIMDFSDIDNETDNIFKHSHIYIWENTMKSKMKLFSIL